MPLSAPVAALVAGAVALRIAAGLGPYSGHADPPKYGDYEAQRHWMEVTLALPPTEWYVNSTANDLSHWGLDYPPLSGWQSRLHGAAVHAVAPAAVALGTSAGHESPASKAALRATVLTSDVAIFFPAAAAAVAAFGGGDAARARGTPPARALAPLWPLAAVLFNPAAIVIDHAHFQYNAISLGLAAAAFALAAAAAPDTARRGGRPPRRLAGVAAGTASTVAFCLAVNHKHMALYYGPALAAHLLGRCLQQRSPAAAAAAVAAHAAAAAAAFAVVWWPWLAHPAGAAAGVGPVLARLAPIGRGVFEDYVANFWCATHPAAKWKRRFGQATLARAAAAATVAAAAPAAAAQVVAPSARGLLHALASASLGAYLFAYQVHEKSILVPLLPVTLLAVASHGDRAASAAAAILPAVATFSMWPLLARDGVWAAYAGCLAVWCALAAPAAVGGSARRAAACAAAVAAAAAMHVAAAVVPPPASLPWLWDAVMTGACFPVFAAAYAFYTWRAVTEPGDATRAVAPRARTAAKPAAKPAVKPAAKPPAKPPAKPAAKQVAAVAAATSPKRRPPRRAGLRSAKVE